MKMRKNKSIPHRSLKALFGQRFRAGSYSVAATAVIVAIAIMVNLIVGSLPTSTTQIDMTSNSLFSLSEQTKQIAAGVDTDVTLYLLCTKGGEDSNINRLLNRYADLNSHIHVESLDPTEKPTFLDQYELELNQLYANSVLVVCGERYRLVGYDSIYVTEYDMDYYSYSYNTTTTFDGENAITNALHYVSSGDLPKVYLTTGHGEAELSETVSEMLAQDNMESEELSLLSLETIPEDATAIVINQPASDLGEDEATLLKDYLADGGNVVLFTAYTTNMPNLLSVTESMGLTLGDGIVLEGDRNMRLNRYPYYLLPEIESHTTTESLISGRYYILAPLSQPIVETENAASSITWLLSTSDAAYSKMAALNMTVAEKEEGDVDGPFHVGAIAEATGKLFWISADAFLDDYINSAVSGGNANLFLNALNWMGGQEDAISIRAKSLDVEGLTVTQSASSFWSIVMIGVIPGVLVAVGVIIWARRKRR